MYDIDKIVNYLKQFKDDISTLYKWNFDIQGLNEFNLLDDININDCSPYEKIIKLRPIIQSKLTCLHSDRKIDLFNKLCLWIIKEWGGIKTGNDKKTIELISGFVKSKNINYNRIASISKVASFMYPKEYIIYDSRVAYSLNWILLSEDAGGKFFPIPLGRNSKMNAYDINVLIRLKNIINYHPKDLSVLDRSKYISQKDSDLFVSKADAYINMINLVKDINNRLWDSERSKYLYYTEMLLFSIADKEVFKDMTNRLHLDIK